MLAWQVEKMIFIYAPSRTFALFHVSGSWRDMRSQCQPESKHRNVEDI